MPKFRKKPVVVEAVRWTGDNLHEVLDFISTRAARWVQSSHQGPLIIIRTLEGEMAALPGDWIICGIKGEYYPCKPGIFAETYDLVED